MDRKMEKQLKCQRRNLQVTTLAPSQPLGQCLGPHVFVHLFVGQPELERERGAWREMYCVSVSEIRVLICIP